MSTTSPPAHARPFHTILTPRLIIRSCVPSDAVQIRTIRANPLNNPFGGVMSPDLPLSVQQKRLEAQQLSTARGENAWMVVILKDEKGTDSSVDDLRVEEGIMIGNTGFNSFPMEPSLADPTKQTIVGDTGILVDYQFARKGYALEALSAVTEYGFVELGCGMMSLGTSAVNQPFRNLMRTMGMGYGILKGEGKEEEAIYLFDREMWEGAKKNMKLHGKWYL